MTAIESQQPKTRVEVWLAQMEKAAESDDNQLLLDVAETLGYFLEHVEEWETGGFDYTDLPHFSREIKWMVNRSVKVGMSIAASRATVYLVTDAEESFVGLYGDVENARDRAAEYPSLEATSVSVEATSPDELLAPLREATGDGPEAVAENLAHIADHWDDVLDGDLRPSDLPRLDEVVRTLCLYAVLFGVLWEYSHPGLFAVFEGDSFRELHHGRSQAENRASELGEDAYAQRVTLADGELGPTDLFEDYPEVA